MLFSSYPYDSVQVMYLPPSLCSQASVWAPSLGFTLLFGSLVVKTWRIYYIFGKINAKNFNKAQFKVRACASRRAERACMLLQIVLTKNYYNYYYYYY